MRTSLPLVGLSAVLALALSACGGGSSADSPPAPVPSSTDSPVETASSSAPDDTSAPPAASGAVDVCSSVSADAMGTALGETVTEKSETIGCGFESSDPKQPVVSLEQKGLDEYAGGFGSATGSLQYLVTDGVEADVDAGSGAHIVVGTPLGGSGGEQGIGMVLVGDQVVQVNLRQDAGLDADAVTKLLTAAVTLVGSQG